MQSGICARIVNTEKKINSKIETTKLKNMVENLENDGFSDNMAQIMMMSRGICYSRS